MMGDEPFFTTFKEFNGGVVTLGHGGTALVGGKGSISLPKCPKSNEVIYVEGPKPTW